MMWRVFALTLMLGGPVAAQDRMTQDQCAQMAAGIGSMVSRDLVMPAVTLSDAGWCTAQGVEFAIDRYSGLRIDRLEWRGSDVARFLDQGLPPRAFEMTASGVSMRALTGDPVLDYLLDVTARGSAWQIGFNLRWDGVQNAVFLDEAFVQFDDTNKIEVSGQVDGVDLTDFATIQTSLGSAGLRNLSVDATFDGWFETFLLLPVGQAILQDNGTDPEDQVTALKQMAADQIAALPDAFMVATSKTALSEFFNDMPNPRGRAQLQITADPTIGAARLAPLMMNATPTLQEAVESTMTGVAVFFRWDRAGG